VDVALDRLIRDNALEPLVLGCVLPQRNGFIGLHVVVLLAGLLFS